MGSDASPESSASLELFAQLKLPPITGNINKESRRGRQEGLCSRWKDAGLTIGEIIAGRACLP